MKKIKDVLRLRVKGGLSFYKIALASGVPKSTVADYCKRFDNANVPIDGALTLKDDELYKLLFGSAICQPAISNSAVPAVPIATISNNTVSHLDETKKPSRPMPNFEYMRRELGKKGVTFELLWEEYKQSSPDGYAITQFKYYYHSYVGKLNPSMRQTYAPGECMFVDYSGLTFPISDMLTGNISKAQIFIAVLGASGYTFVHASPSQKKEHFILSHTLAFSFFEGVPVFVVPDNLKSAITSNTRHGGVVVNESYDEMARHYDTIIQPARPYKPRDKAKAEQGVQAVQRWILAKLRHQTFFSIEELNDALSPLLDAYNNKILKRIDKSRSEMYWEMDKPFLKPLPINTYVYKEYKVATVNVNYHVELERCFYSVPYALIKEKVEIAYSTSTLWIIHKSQVVATHAKIYRAGSYQTKEEHMPPQHMYSTQNINPLRLLGWAKTIGDNAEAFVEQKLTSAAYPPSAYRSVIAILKLAKRFSNEELELSLKYAYKRNIHAYRQVESILDKKLYALDGIDSKTIQDDNNNHTACVSNKAHRGPEYYY